MRFPFPAPEPVADATGGHIAMEPEARAAEPSIAPVPERETSAPDPPAAESPAPAGADLPEPDSGETTAGADVPNSPVNLPPESVTAAALPQPAEDAAPAVVESAPPLVRPRSRSKRKVIAFPYQPGTAGSVSRLADPVLPETPRILDVPEELEAFPTTPFLDGLKFEATAAAADREDRLELSFRVASIGRRIYAASVDCGLVGMAAAIFAAITYKMLPDLTLTKPARLSAAVMPLVLWAIYQYLSLVYAGRTAGMKVAGIRLSVLKGRKLSLRQRRNRILALYLSSASLAMGLLWAFVDVDTLCWHDRISGTYLTKPE